MNKSKFNIISKVPKGQKENVIYTFTYQKDGIPKNFEVKMIYLTFRKENRWAFMCGKESDVDFTEDEKKEFIAEIPKFQKGSSYRKTHPIAYSKSEEIRNIINIKNKEIQKLEHDYNRVKREEDNILITKYREYIKDAKVDEFIKGYNELVSKTGCTITGIKYYSKIKSVKDDMIVSGMYINDEEKMCKGGITDWDISSYLERNLNIVNKLKG